MPERPQASVCLQEGFLDRVPRQLSVMQIGEAKTKQSELVFVYHTGDLFLRRTVRALDRFHVRLHLLSPI